MRTTLLSAVAVSILGLTSASAVLAQETTRQGETPSYGAGAAPACTQLELVHGLRGDECGKLSLSELAKMKISRDNT